MSSSSYKMRKSSPLLFRKLDKFFPDKKMLRSSSDKSLIIKNKYSLSFALNKKEKEKTKIIWSEDGKKIFLTGSFCNWEKLYLMKKNNKDEYFYYFLYLPKGFYQFKFKVDGKWKNSSFYPKINNHGDINNYLDNTSSNYEFASLSTNESSIISSTLNNKNNNNKIINNKNVNNKIDFTFCKKNYCIYYPKIKEMREYTDKKPSNFQIECYHGINQIQNIIGNKKYLFLEENDIFSGNYSYKNIERKDHILLNHLCQKQKNRRNNNNIIITSIVIKYRHKNCTFLYYK